MTARPPFDILPDAVLFGREEVAARLVGLLSGPEAGHKAQVLVAGPRWVGKTELIRKLHCTLFENSSGVAPVYFPLDATAGPAELAEDFLRELTVQYVAFMRRDAAFSLSSLPLERLERMLASDARASSTGLALILRRHRECVASGDSTAVFRNAVSAPGVIGANTGVPVALLFDSLASRPGGLSPARDLIASVSGSAAFVVAARDERALDGLPLAGPVDLIRLEPLDPESSMSLLAELSKDVFSGVDADVLGVASCMLGGIPAYMRMLVRAAASAPAGSLSDTRGLAELYTREVTTGAIGRALASAMDLGTDELSCAHAIISRSAGGPRTITAEELADSGGAASLERLVAAGVLESRGGTFRWSADPVMRDHIEFAYDVKLSGKGAEEVYTRMLRDALRRAYRQIGFSSGIGVGFSERVAALLREFGGQRLPREFFFNSLFSAGGKDAISKGQGAVGRGPEIVLPELIGSFDTRRWEPDEAGPVIMLAEGFERSRQYSGAEAVWLVGIKQGASPVNMGDVVAFLRRTSKVAANLPAVRITRWMAAEGGFTPEAAERLDSEGVLSTGFAAVRMIEGLVADAAAGTVMAVPEAEYEVVLPSSERAELVAAGAASEICSSMGFDEDASTEVRTALVEACINAFEHGGGAGSGVRLRFATSSDRLEVQVINRGAPFSGPVADGPGGAAETTGGAASGPDAGREVLPHRRGWGIELMRSLMDTVRFDRLKWGTRLVMVKYLDAKGDRSDVREA